MNKLYVIGIGPGDASGMTYAAKAAIETSDIIVGYTKYVELVTPLFPEKPTYATPMMGEVKRCKHALELANSGQTVALVCSGDAGVYGMAGLVLELAPKFTHVDIEIVAGVSAALAGAALLGAPLTHDFAVISLSDLLTPWELIVKRLECAAQGDFCLALYNPSSIRRHDFLQKACTILLKFKSPQTICGYTKNIGRDGEAHAIMTLGELSQTQVDMFTTVFIGNSETKLIASKMVTPRGYQHD